MTLSRPKRAEKGTIGWLLLWLMGIPIPVLLLLLILRDRT